MFRMSRSGRRAAANSPLLSTAVDCSSTISQKGDLKQCANYRTIVLLVSHASKILLRVILETIRVKTVTTADEQAGFRQGRGTRDQITNLRILVHEVREHQQRLYRPMFFVDSKKAFDSISHDELWDYDGYRISSALD